MPTKRRLYAGLAATAIVGFTTAALALTVPPASASTLFSEDFEAGAPAGWSTAGGDWSVVEDGSLAYRQSKGTGAAARVLAGEPDWTDYAVRARVRPITVDGGGFAGVAVRASDPATMYRLVLTSAGTAELHAVRGGEVTVLGAAPVAAAIGTFHTLDVRADDDTITGWVDGALIGTGTAEASDRGRLGLVTSLATASFDDISAVTPGEDDPAPGQDGSAPVPTRS
ncbi:family 16 glycoside hydrolase [Catenuloplanes japonicus]|uniref:family 16 glycoside hydrolase n=1 Tax=Catenuloplanes japonicus TaxID=33876 RepID=UPI00068F529A|nr:family 16 glycoside hydrolase [Catenuloplanes japonicus]